jgi:NTE family protein
MNTRDNSDFLFSRLVLLIILLSFVTCAPKYNVKLGPQSAQNPLPPAAEQDEQTLVFVALSGGGTRAAAMSWRVLETFKKIPYEYEDRSGKTVRSNLADQIDYISGISGGSFAAAGFCVYKNDMDIFRKRFIERNIQGAISKRLFVPPWNLMRLVSSDYDRINIASELYDEEVFGGKTFGDLPPRPVLWVNATHLALGTRFTFTNEYFRLLDSDINKYPVGYACAASSAFPILLSPLTVLNFSGSAPLTDIDYRMAKLNARENIEKDFYCRMREFYNDPENKYMHLADGGLVDNQGLQAIIDQFETNGIINTALNDSVNPLKRLIVINVNAGVVPGDDSCKEVSSPSIPSVVEYTMSMSMDILSAKRWMMLRDLMDSVYKGAIDAKGKGSPLGKLEKPYAIEISFRNLRDEARKAKCNKLPTSFHLDDEQLRLIDDAVPVLIDDDPDMKRLRSVIEKKSRP